ncbi:MAG TPA: 30S ribosome-binding factor RbfA [Stellaceae bacterium]|jgi:ribosome-binding factor A
MSRRHDSSPRDGRTASQRQLRVGEELRHALARILERHELRDPGLQDATITVTEVRISPDLRNATAYVMPLGGAHVPDILAGLRRSAGYLRSAVVREVNLRHAPALSFAIDTSFEHASRIDALLHRPEVQRDLDQDPDGPGDDDGGGKPDGDEKPTGGGDDRGHDGA